MRKKCECCGTVWLFDDSDVVILMPFPHWECPKCGSWIAAF